MAKEAVVLVHGLWMNGWDMSVLRKRLEVAGFDCRRFSYRSIRSTPLENSMDLNVYLQSLDAPVIHLVAHSLGGLLLRHLFHEYPGQRPGRVVTLGTPHQPSSAAHSLAQYPLTRMLLGKSVVNGLLGNVPPWNNDHELGSIAGDLRLGVGVIIPGVVRPGDATVAVAETRLEGMKDHAVVHATHTGLLLSKHVAEQVILFLHTGQFNKSIEHQQGQS